MVGALMTNIKVLQEHDKHFLKLDAFQTICQLGNQLTQNETKALVAGIK